MTVSRTTKTEFAFICAYRHLSHSKAKLPIDVGEGTAQEMGAVGIAAVSAQQLVESLVTRASHYPDKLCTL